MANRLWKIVDADSAPVEISLSLLALCTSVAFAVNSGWGDYGLTADPWIAWVFAGAAACVSATRVWFAASCMFAIRQLVATFSALAMIYLAFASFKAAALESPCAVAFAVAAIIESWVVLSLEARRVERADGGSRE
ncbi:MAG: hypothetical protein NXI11_04030 [Proteobacteria bacterium]|nr:hypothetical protein [Pseudomonadota bacterium]